MNYPISPSPLTKAGGRSLRVSESGVSESGGLFLFILPTPHTPHPTPHTHEKLFAANPT
ncbi:MAG: hypothetical protein ACK47N_16775 [Microcystis sp.]|uniref:hypothetical protein n=1 Tax=Microcystis sp. TaxID=1127 RepID=UPI0039199905